MRPPPCTACTVNHLILHAFTHVGTSVMLLPVVGLAPVHPSVFFSFAMALSDPEVKKILDGSGWALLSKLLHVSPIKNRWYNPILEVWRTSLTNSLWRSSRCCGPRPIQKHFGLISQPSHVSSFQPVRSECHVEGFWSLLLPFYNLLSEDVLSTDQALVIKENFDNKGAVFELARYLKNWEADRH